jgi:hypothetical protein
MFHSLGYTVAAQENKTYSKTEKITNNLIERITVDTDKKS